MPMSGPSLEESLSELSVDQRKSFPSPPRLHWVVLLLIAFGLDAAGERLGHSIGVSWLNDGMMAEACVVIWATVQASFVWRLIPNTTLFLTTAAAGAFVIASAFLSSIGRLDTDYWAAALGLIGYVTLWVDLYRMRSTLERHYNSVEHYGLSMSVFWLFLFGPFYLQYHLRKVALWKDQQSSTLQTR
jgi:hypothetical protein